MAVRSQGYPYFYDDHQEEYSHPSENIFISMNIAFLGRHYPKAQKLVFEDIKRKATELGLPFPEFKEPKEIKRLFQQSDGWMRAIEEAGTLRNASSEQIEALMVESIRSYIARTLEAEGKDLETAKLIAFSAPQDRTIKSAFIMMYSLMHFGKDFPSNHNLRQKEAESFFWPTIENTR